MYNVKTKKKLTNSRTKTKVILTNLTLLLHSLFDILDISTTPKTTLKEYTILYTFYKKYKHIFANFV